MNTFTNLIVEFRAGLRKIADDMENHEAAAEAAIAKLQSLRGKTAIEGARLQRQVGGLNQQIETQDREIADWRDRAKRAAAIDEAKALECVRRMANAQQQRAVLIRELDATEALAADIRGDLDTMDERLRDLRRRRAAFASRQAKAESGMVGGTDITFDEGAENVFDRWEHRILLKEIHSPSEPARGKDRFESDFREEEEAVRLRELLQTIIQSEE